MIAADPSSRAASATSTSPVDEVVTAPVWTVLCVDDEPYILAAISRVFRGTGHRVLLAGNGAEALQRLNDEAVNLVISDMRMPGMDGAQLLEQVRQRWPAITRILLTGHADIASTVASINRGEVFRYLTKPWHDDQLLAAVREAFERQALLREQLRLEELVARRNDELAALNSTLEGQICERTASLTAANLRLDRNLLHSIKAFSSLIELRNASMAGHSRRVADLARRIAVQMNLSASETQDVFVAGLLHDIGQVGLSDTMLACPVPRMTVEEKALYTRHPALGEQALLPLDDMQRVATLVRSHHERHDGLGFPDGLRADAIPLGARILALSDTFDDLQSGHLSRSPLSSDEARMLISRGRDAQFDGQVIDAFIAVTRLPEPPPASKNVTFDQLRPGMVLAKDLRSQDGVVLLAADHLLTADLIERIGGHAARRNLTPLFAIRLLPGVRTT